MWGSATIGIYNNLTTSKATIPVGATDYKTTGRVNIKFFLRAHPTIRESLLNMRANDLSYLILV